VRLENKTQFLFSLLLPPLLHDIASSFFLSSLLHFVLLNGKRGGGGKVLPRADLARLKECTGGRG
jgi:hypothetical protein